MTKKNDLEFLSEPRRQSSVAIFLILLKSFRVILGQAWPIFIALIFNPTKSKDTYFALAIIGITAASAIRSIILYFKFYYYVKNDELIIEKGIFQKTKLNVPFDRIQTINFKENILHQFFNVVSLEIDTAGSKGNEFSITALKKDKAIAIREFLLAQKKSSTPTPFSEEDVEEEMEIPEEELLHLSPLDLVKIGVSQNHLRTAAIVFAFMFTSMDYIEDITGWKLENGIDNLLGSSSNTLLMGLITIVPFFIIIAFLISLVRTVIRYYDLRFFKTALGFKVVAGLFTRNEQSASMQKIQLIRWTTNPIKKAFSLFDISLRQAASTAIARKQSIYVPGCYEEQLSSVRAAYFPEESQLSFEEHVIHPLVIYRRVLYFGLLPAGIFLLNGYWDGEMGNYYWAIIWVVIVLLLSWVYQRNFKYFVSDEGIRVSTSIIGRTETLLKWFKIQGVEIQQGIYQRRKDLCNLVFHTAAGTVKIPYIELEKAKMMEDFVLYKIENSEEPWM
ncbi:MAG: PH domain-containing protein [Saprospiraceae bacterium]